MAYSITDGRFTMASGFKANRRGIEQMKRELTKEFARSGPIPIPVSGVDRSPRRENPTSVNHFHGPVVRIENSTGTQVTINSDNVIQSQGIERSAPEEFAELVTLLRTLVPQLDDHELSDTAKQDVRDAAADVLNEVVQEAPDAGRIRRAVATVKGTLTTLALAGAGKAVSDESQQWAAAAIDGLTALVS